MNQNNDRAWVATRKGLLDLRRCGSVWSIENVSFLREPVSRVLPPAAGDSRLLAALTTGHDGTSVHASEDAGHTGVEVAAPTYPLQPEGAEADQKRVPVGAAMIVNRTRDGGRSFETLPPAVAVRFG